MIWQTWPLQYVDVFFLFFLQLFIYLFIYLCLNNNSQFVVFVQEYSSHAKAKVVLLTFWKCVQMFQFYVEQLCTSYFNAFLLEWTGNNLYIVIIVSHLISLIYTWTRKTLASEHAAPIGCSGKRWSRMCRLFLAWWAQYSFLWHIETQYGIGHII